MRGKWRKPKNDTAAVAARRVQARAWAPRTDREYVQRDFCLGSRQRRAQTIVDARAEGDMVAEITIQPKFIRILKHSGITICCTIVDRPRLSLPES